MVLVADSKKEAVTIVDLKSPHRPVFILGLGLLGVVLLDLVAMWWSPQFGTASWEMGTITQTLGRMPMLLLALALVAGAGMLAGSVRTVRAAAVGFYLLGLVSLLLALGYGVAAVELWRTVPPDMADSFKRSAVATAGLVVVYMATCWTLGVMVWKQTRKGRS